MPHVACDTTMLAFQVFSPFADRVRVAVTSRAGGVSTGEYASLNMGFLSGDDPACVIENRRRAVSEFRGREVADAAELSSLWTGVKQVHGAEVLVATREHAGSGALSSVLGQPGGPAAEADAICTNETGLVLNIQVADCAPVVVYDAENHALGVAHCGWRGTAAHALIRLLETMGGEYGTRAKDVYAGIGPGICGKCYIVGGDAARHFIGREYEGYRVLWDAAPKGKDADGAALGCGDAGTDRKYHLNIWGALHAQLVNAGAPPQQIETMVKCSYEEAALFYSYRRDGKNCGRNALMAELV